MGIKSVSITATALILSTSVNAALLMDTSMALHPINNGGVGYVCESCTLGYEFTLNSTETIKALGLWDFQADGLKASHQVGLWDLAGNLLASTTITNSSVAIASPNNDPSLASRWLFNNIADTILTAGTYRLGMTQSTGPQDLTARGPSTFNLNGSLGGGYIGGFKDGGTTLAFPDIKSDPDGFYGPNLSTSTVPVPAAAWLFGTGLIGLAVVARRKEQY